MIFNTGGAYDTSHIVARLYPQLDPKYVYPQKAITASRSYIPTVDGHSAEKPFFSAGLDDLMGLRQDVVSQKISMITTEIYQRYRLQESNLYEINQSQCTLRNLIYRIGDEFLDKKRIDIERTIIDLEQEKRREKANCFKDLLWLRRELRGTLIEKIEEDQKASMLLGDGGI